MGRTINGFSEAEVYDLYSFVCRFEKIKHYKKKKELELHYLGFSEELDKLLKGITLNHPKRKGWNLKDLSSGNVASPHFYFRRKGCVTYDILYHLRNAIAHGYINIDGKNNDYVRVRDYDSLSNRQTANALIPISVFRDIVKHVNNDIKL